MRILIVEPDASTAQSMELMLRSEHFNVYTTDDADEAVEIGKMYDYDLIVLSDVTFAHRALQQLRTARCKTPILRLSPLAMVEDIAAALNAGADDYLTKPFHKDELVARIHAIVRRSKGHARSLVQVGPLCLDMDSKLVSVAGEAVHLTGKEYAMLELMALRVGSLITKEMFLNHLYGGLDEPEMKIIDVFICKLRKKLGEHHTLVATVWGRGYVLRQGEGESEPDAPRSFALTTSEGITATEVRDFTDDPPSHAIPVSACKPSFGDVMRHRKAHGVRQIASPPLVPALGQK